MAIVVDLQTRQAIEYITRELSQIEKDQAIRKGLSEAAKVFERFGRANLAIAYKGKGTGAIFNTFSTKVVYKRKNGESPTSYAGLRWPEGYTAHWLDLGTKERVQKKTGKKVGRVKATYFFTNAREEGERPAMEALYDGVQRMVDRINSRR